MPITLYIKNALHASELGLGDGTIYASGTVNLEADISQANNTFTLTGFTLDALTGTDTDDFMNGYLLYFQASGNTYHVVDWVASTDTATTHEMPQITDTGACEFRRALFDNKALAGNPLLNAADGRLDSVWKTGTPQSIQLYLENAIDDGGFEQTISAWNIGRLGGTSDTSGVNAVAPLIGAADFKLSLGDRSIVNISQFIKRPLKSGRTYRLIFKAKTSAAFVQGGVKVSLGRSVAGDFNIYPQLPQFSSPSSGDISLGAWNPTLTTTSTWYYADMIMPYDINPLNKIDLRFTIVSSAFNVFIDEIYFFEKINVDSLLVFGNNSDFRVGVTSRNVPKDRTGQTAGIDNSVTLAANTIMPFSEKVSQVDLTASIAPIYEISSTVAAIDKASQILLSEKWTWEFNPDMPFDAESIEYDEKTIKSRSGVERIIRHSKKRTVKGKYSSMSAIERAILKNDLFPHHIDEERHPFAYQLNSTDTPLFVRVSQSKFGLNRSSGLLDDWDFAFDEVL